jgi:nicotinamidase-related amidase
MSIEFISGLKFGALSPKTLHLCIDMQLMFALETKWASEAIWRALPGILEVSSCYTSQTVFTRFICPRDLSETTGQWTRFYADAEGMLSNNLHPSMLDLLPELIEFIPPARIVDRKVFSAFASSDLRTLLAQESTDTLVITGLETDVCVLVTVMAAIDLGYRVILIKDALASSNEAGEKAALHQIYSRFDQQIEVIDTEELFRNWDELNEVPKKRKVHEAGASGSQLRTVPRTKKAGS